MNTKPSGLWVPLITPFKDGAVDYASYERLIDHYLAFGVDGLFPLGTTGESPTLDDAEIEQLVERTVARAGVLPARATVRSTSCSISASSSVGDSPVVPSGKRPSTPKAR